MAWDEWEQLKAGVAERQSAGMRLNSSGGTDRLKSSRQGWLSAGEGVGSLRGRIGTALGRLEDGQAGLGDTDGCLSAAAQKDLYASWRTYAENVSKRCGSLQKIMERVGHEQLRTDESVEAGIASVKSAYADTAAVGGAPQRGR
ncbi:hypothetical protein [Streptomyces sp. NPDC001889]